MEASVLILQCGRARTTTETPTVIIDHFCYGTRNLYETAAALRDSSGLNAYDGGWFPRIGVGMRVVPLPLRQQYIEIESVIDHDVAMASEFGRWIYSVSRTDRLIGWSIRCETWEELESVSRRIGYPIEPSGKLRQLPDGSWIELYSAAPTPKVWPQGLPNFIYWDRPEIHPGRVVLDHPRRPGEIAWIEYGDPESKLREWLGEDGAALPIRYRTDARGVLAAAIATESGEEIVIRPELT